MDERRQEKLGWVAGWLGGFGWVLILAVVFLFQQRPLSATIGLIIVGVACATIFLIAPWRYPNTQYRTLMVPIYVLFVIAIVWAVSAMGGPQQLGFNNWWSLLILLPALLPLWLAGNRRWGDGASGRGS